MSVEQARMRLEVLRGECLGQIRIRFQRKVQLEDECQDNEAKLHFERGHLAGLDEAVNSLAEIEKLNKGQLTVGTQVITSPPLYAPQLLTPEPTPDGNWQGGNVFDVTIVAQNVPVQNL